MHVDVDAFLKVRSVSDADERGREFWVKGVITIKSTNAESLPKIPLSIQSAEI